MSSRSLEARAQRDARLLACCLALSLTVLAGCASFISPTRLNDADLRFMFDSPGGSTLSASARQTLIANKISTKCSAEQVAALEKILLSNASPELIYAYAETAYVVARKLEKKQPVLAKRLYFQSALHAYHYLFNPQIESTRDNSVYRGKLTDARLLYNGACERFLKLEIDDAKKSDDPFPFAQHSLKMEDDLEQPRAVYTNIFDGVWAPEEYDSFEVAAECAVYGFSYPCERDGVGAPLVVKRKRSPSILRKEEQLYPPGIRFAATAVLRPNPIRPLGAIPPLDPSAKLPNDAENADALLEIYDPLKTTSAVLEGKSVPLEADCSTPLAYYLSMTEKSVTQAGVNGLLKPEKLSENATFGNASDDDEPRERTLQGLYMFEPFDPNKIPVVMTHGLGSTPITWMEMYNALHNTAVVQNAYQFMFFFYPTGQPFWASAAMMRRELEEFRNLTDPERQAQALDHMVLIGHSMGGLVSKMQVQESGNRIWSLISSKPFDSVELDDETRADLRSWFFFEPNASARCVVTIATPFEGSEYANSFTKRIAEQAIKLPKTVARAIDFAGKDQNGDIQDATLLQIATSVDSLSPKDPIFKALDECPVPENVELYNIVGVAPSLEKKIFGRRKSDGVVDYESASRNDVVDQLEAPAYHTEVHAHPAAVTRVKEILEQKLSQTYAEIESQNATNQRSTPFRLGAATARDASTLVMPKEFATEPSAQDAKRNDATKPTAPLPREFIP